MKLVKWWIKESRWNVVAFGCCLLFAAGDRHTAPSGDLSCARSGLDASMTTIAGGESGKYGRQLAGYLKGCWHAFKVEQQRKMMQATQVAP